MLKKLVAGYAAADTTRSGRTDGSLPAELNGVASDDLGSHIFIAVGPLIQNAADIGPEGLRIDAADLSNAVGGKSTGDCELSVTSFQRHPAALARSSLRRVGEKVWFQMTENASLI